MTKNSNLSISKVKLRDDGLKGVTVVYEKPSTRADINFRDDYTVRYKAPVNKEVTDAFNRLTTYLNDICCLNFGAEAQEVRVTGIESDGDTFFKLIGQVSTYGGREFEIKTPKMQDDGEYPRFHDCTSDISDVYNEIRLYIREKKVLDKKAMAEGFARKDAIKQGEEFDPSTVSGMDDQALTRFCLEHLEKTKGAIVIMDDELAADEAGKVVSLSESVNIPSAKVANV